MPSSSSDPGSGCTRKRKRALHSDVSPPSPSKPNLQSNSNEGSSTLAILSGLTLAISTLDVKGQKHSKPENSYKKISKAAKRLGAKVTGQVHKRVSVLLCTNTSLEKATQRVRKARQYNIPLVDVLWLHECERRKSRVDWNDYEFKNGDTCTHSRSKKVSNHSSIMSDFNSDNEDISETGWSEGVALGCCCVCHENQDPDCPWCVDCSINVAKRKAISDSEKSKK
mmetsp:Transcript_16179/g.24729  ORF Transcript_16179/g.24729 Transcript_16179/m.24729 type:complete len:225 (-) Transcript_16179:553-1227(-)